MSMSGVVKPVALGVGGAFAASVVSAQVFQEGARQRSPLERYGTAVAGGLAVAWIFGVRDGKGLVLAALGAFAEPMIAEKIG